MKYFNTTWNVNEYLKIPAISMLFLGLCAIGPMTPHNSLQQTLLSTTDSSGKPFQIEAFEYQITNQDHPVILPEHSEDALVTQILVDSILKLQILSLGRTKHIPEGLQYESISGINLIRQFAPIEGRSRKYELYYNNLDSTLKINALLIYTQIIEAHHGYLQSFISDYIQSNMPKIQQKLGYLLVQLLPIKTQKITNLNQLIYFLFHLWFIQQLIDNPSKLNNIITRCRFRVTQLQLKTVSNTNCPLNIIIIKHNNLNNNNTIIPYTPNFIINHPYAFKTWIDKGDLTLPILDINHFFIKLAQFIENFYYFDCEQRLQVTHKRAVCSFISKIKTK